MRARILAAAVTCLAVSTIASPALADTSSESCTGTAHSLDAVIGEVTAATATNPTRGFVAKKYMRGTIAFLGGKVEVNTAGATNTTTSVDSKASVRTAVQSPQSAKTTDSTTITYIGQTRWTQTSTGKAKKTGPAIAKERTTAAKLAAAEHGNEFTYVAETARDRLGYTDGSKFTCTPSGETKYSLRVLASTTTPFIVDGKAVTSGLSLDIEAAVDKQGRLVRAQQHIAGLDTLVANWTVYTPGRVPTITAPW